MILEYQNFDVKYACKLQHFQSLVKLSLIKRKVIILLNFYITRKMEVKYSCNNESNIVVHRSHGYNWNIGAMSMLPSELLNKIMAILPPQHAVVGDCYRKK
jgi:hypothetical protein